MLVELDAERATANMSEYLQLQAVGMETDDVTVFRRGVDQFVRSTGDIFGATVLAEIEYPSGRKNIVRREGVNEANVLWRLPGDGRDRYRPQRQV